MVWHLSFFPKISIVTHDLMHALFKNTIVDVITEEINLNILIVTTV